MNAFKLLILTVLLLSGAAAQTTTTYTFGPNQGPGCYTVNYCFYDDFPAHTLNYDYANAGWVIFEASGLAGGYSCGDPYITGSDGNVGTQSNLQFTDTQASGTCQNTFFGVPFTMTWLVTGHWGPRGRYGIRKWFPTGATVTITQ